VLDVARELQVGLGVGGVAVSGKIERYDAVALGERTDVVGVGLQLATGAMHQDEVRSSFAGLQHAGVPSTDLDVADCVGHCPECHPYRSFCHFLTSFSWRWPS